MLSKNQLARFSEKWWQGKDAEIAWRHWVALELIEEEPILDVGGGDGLFLSMLKKHGFRELSLLDVSPTAVARARQAGLDADTADITEGLPFKDNSFGTMVALDVLEHLLDPLSLLIEMGRVGRSVVVVVPNFHYWRERARMILGQVTFQCDPKRGHVYWFNHHVLMDMMNWAGLEAERIIQAGFTKFGPLGGWLAGAWPNLFSYSIAARMVPKGGHLNEC